MLGDSSSSVGFLEGNYIVQGEMEGGGVVFEVHWRSRDLRSAHLLEHPRVAHGAEQTAHFESEDIFGDAVMAADPLGAWGGRRIATARSASR
jgi:hypothetical protein